MRINLVIYSMFILMYCMISINFSQVIKPVSESIIQIGTFNLEWFPCKDDGEMMRKYGIELRYPPHGQATDIKALFSFLKDLDIELLAVEEIVDPKLFADSAKKYLGEQYKFIYSPSGGDQKVGFLYDSTILGIQGKPKTYMEVALSNDSRLRPAFGAYFKVLPAGFDFTAIVIHLKASPRGWNLRKKQWSVLDEILTTLPKETGDGDIILLGDFNDVSKLKTEEFDSVIQKTNFYRVTQELDTKISEYWQPDYKKERIEGSIIDHIFISADARIEFIGGSCRVGGMCAEGKAEYIDDSIPDYYYKISDHCPVYSSFKVDIDND